MTDNIKPEEQYISNIQKGREKQQLNSRKFIIKDSLRELEEEKIDLLKELVSIDVQLKVLSEECNDER